MGLTEKPAKEPTVVAWDVTDPDDPPADPPEPSVSEVIAALRGPGTSKERLDRVANLVHDGGDR